MEHDYEFFDRDVYDPIWQLSWHQFMRLYKTRWALNQNYSSGTYTGQSLRELIAFSLDPEPANEEIENILQHRTIRWTIRRSSPQFFTMSCIMWDGLPQFRDRTVHLSTCSEIDCLLAVAVGAYLERRIDINTLRAVLKLHSVEDLDTFVRLNQQEKSKLKSAAIVKAIGKPLYSWQGDSCLADEEWANCLGVADTRRFIDFVAQAWNDNWAARRLREQVLGSGHECPRFRDFEFAKELAKPLLRKSHHLKSPSVFRRWN